MAKFIPDSEADVFFGSTPQPASSTPTAKAPRFIPDSEADAFFGTPTASNEPFLYEVDQNEEDKALEQSLKLSRYAKEDAERKAEADKYKGFGFVKQLGKEVVRRLPIVGAPTRQGEATGQQMATGNVAKNLLDSEMDQDEIKVSLIKAIREGEAKGENVNRLKIQYNELVKGGINTGNELNKIVPGKNQTTQQALGNLGEMALDIGTAGTYKAPGAKTGKLLTKPATVVENVSATVPMVKKIEEVAKKSKGLFTKSGEKAVLKGAGIGYGYDVVAGAQGIRGEDRTGAKAFIPGAATVFGAAVPAVAGGIQTLKNIKNPDVRIQKIVSERTKDLQKLEDNYAALRRVTEKTKQKGIDPKSLLAQTDLLNNAVDNTGTIRTENAMQELNDFIKPQENVISDNLRREGVMISLKDVKAKLLSNIDDSGIKGGAKIRAIKNVEDDIAGLLLEADKEGRIPLATVHAAKVDKYANINFMNPESKRVDKAIARGFKELVEKNTTSVNVKSLNDELASHYSVLDFLEKLDGKKVEGGKLGKHFSKTLMAVYGSAFGPLGTIIGAEVGGRLKGNRMASTFKGKTGKKLTQSQAMKDAIIQSKSPRLALPAPKSKYRSQTYVGRTIKLPAKSQSTIDAQHIPFRNHTLPVKNSTLLLRDRNPIILPARNPSTQSSANSLGSRNIPQSKPMTINKNVAISKTLPAGTKVVNTGANLPKKLSPEMRLLERLRLNTTKTDWKNGGIVATAKRLGLEKEYKKAIEMLKTK